MNMILNDDFYFTILTIWIILALFTFFILLIIKPSTYGRHIDKNRLSINNRLGWFIMELPTVILMPFFYFINSTDCNPVILFFISLYMLHYLNRVFVFPLRIRTRDKKIPILIVFSAILFNTCNTFLIGYYFSQVTLLYDLSWFFSLPFITGLIVFLAGAYINHQSDTILINLRKGSKNGYKIPHGGLFKYISCPNHLGEIIEWIGFAILTCSLPTFAFAIWTIANLMPRALQHHYWYKENFTNYPKERKAIIPYLI